MQRVVVSLTRNTVKNSLKQGNQMISANDRMHYRVKQGISAYLRELGSQLCPTIDKQYSPENPCHVTVYVHAPSARKQDPANWNPTIKPILDGLRTQVCGQMITVTSSNMSRLQWGRIRQHLQKHISLSLSLSPLK